MFSPDPGLERASGDGNGGSPADVDVVRFKREELGIAVQHEFNSLLLIEDPPITPGAGPCDDTTAEAQDAAKRAKRKPWSLVCKNLSFFLYLRGFA